MDELLRQVRSLSSHEKYALLQELIAGYSGTNLFIFNGCVAYSAKTVVINNYSSESLQIVLDLIAEEIGHKNKSDS